MRRRRWDRCPKFQKAMLKANPLILTQLSSRPGGFINSTLGCHRGWRRLGRCRRRIGKQRVDCCRVGVAQGHMVKGAPIICDMVGLILVSQQLVKTVFRVIARNATMPQCHNATMQRCHNATMPRCHNATMPQCHNATMPRYHNATTPQSHNAKMLQCHNAW